MDERERQKLIAKLKTAGSSEERDRILWYLAGQDKDARGRAQRAEPMGTRKPASAKAEDKPRAGFPLGKLGGVGSFTALLFLFYGLVTVVTAVMRILQGQMAGDEIRQLIMGGLFLLFGIVIYLRGRRQQQETAEET
ncbi:MAG: hypothetical protein HPY67_00500 [Syntrophaceae bacterium]|nr:hypothetical protein [Syntrophaceae bacterium]